MILKRQLNIFNILDAYESCFIFGPRGSGKTSLVTESLGQLNGGLLKLDLLKTDQFKRYLQNPSLLRLEVQELIKPEENNRRIFTVFIDEIQKIPALLDEIHGLIEEFPGKVRFILTGSSARKLKRSGANLLAGRASTLHLHPLSCCELDIKLDRALQYGTLPRPYLMKNAPERFLRSYVDTYLKEEIQQEALVRKLEPFVRFLDLAGQYNGVPVKVSRLAKQLGVSPKTAEEYFDILVDTLIAFRIPPWSYSVIKQLQGATSHYFFDCGVLNALSGELRTSLRPGTFRYGKLFETYVVNEFIRQNDYSELGFKFFCFRLDSGFEIDLIASRGPRDTPRAIEIKAETAPDEVALRSLANVRNYIPNARMYCICATPRRYKIGEIDVLPWQDGITTVLAAD